jgi:hypothetical protein
MKCDPGSQEKPSVPIVRGTQNLFTTIMIISLYDDGEANKTI